jgi:hypothetical protein
LKEAPQQKARKSPANPCCKSLKRVINFVFMGTKSTVIFGRPYNNNRQTRNNNIKYYACNDKIQFVHRNRQTHQSANKKEQKKCIIHLLPTNNMQ